MSLSHHFCKNLQQCNCHLIYGSTIAVEAKKMEGTASKKIEWTKNNEMEGTKNKEIEGIGRKKIEPIENKDNATHIL